MDKRARIGLLLGATSCLLAVMVDWIVADLRAADGPDGDAPRSASAPRRTEPDRAGEGQV